MKQLPILCYGAEICVAHSYLYTMQTNLATRIKM